MPLSKEEAVAKLIFNFSANSRKAGKQKKTKGFLIARKNLLADYWQKYNAIRDDISIMDATADETAVKRALSEDRYASIESAYCDALGELHDEIDELSHNVNDGHVVPPSNSTLSSPLSTPKSILPKIELPKFDGSFQKWLCFKDMFVTCIVQDSSLSNVQRMHYLKGSLQGEAEAMLRNLNVMESNFQIAWDMLQKRYDNKRRMVKSYLRSIIKISPVQTESDMNLRKLLDSVTESVRALKQLGRPTNHWDDWLVFLVTEKLHPVTVKDWEMSLVSSDVLPEYDALTSFLEKRIQGLEAIVAITKVKPKESIPNPKPAQHATICSHQTSFGRCPCCAGKHSLMYCSEFRRKTPNAKLDVVMDQKLCKNCLKANHTSSDCVSTYTCQKCMQKHHTILHDSVSSSPSSTSSPRYTCTNSIAQQKTIEATAATLTPALLATARIGVRSPSGHFMKLRALLDNGSQTSFISEFAVQRLHLSKNRLSVTISGVGGSTVGESKALVQFSVCSLTEPNFSIACSALVLPRLGQSMPSNQIDPTAYSDFLGLSLADPKFYEPGSIDIIIGADLYGTLLRNDLKRSACGDSTAQNTRLGWVVYGRLPVGQSRQLSARLCATATAELSTLVEQMWKFNQIDDITPPSLMTEDEVYCEEFFKRTVRRDHLGRYHIRYPFKESSVLSDSKWDAMKLYAYQQRRLQHDAKMNELYNEFMNEYITLGHMEQICEDREPQYACYIPHHGVYKEGSSTTKLRTVFNGSRKYKSGLSLNDCLHVGPKLQNDLSSIILKWRMYRVGFMADIEKCFRQIRVDQRDADMQRIVWRDGDGQLTAYRLLTVTYGLTCSPYITIKVLNTLAEDEEAEFPKASKILKQSFYVDDCLHGGDTVEEAIDIQIKLRQLLSRGCFNLRKWSSNSNEFMQHLSTDDIQQDICCNLNLDRETKALGIYWLCDSDSLTYKVNITPVSGLITKRQQLSDVAKIYDPPGFLAPIVITGKKLCQQLWLLGCNWDDPLPDPLQDEWRRFREELHEVQNLRVPRWIGVTPTVNSYQLHVFSDASTSAYAAAAYIRVEAPDSACKVAMLTAKTKVAPLKKVTVPCLELNGALLASKVAAKIIKTMQLPFSKIYCWSDSKTTLSWIRSRPGQHKQYVSNRISQIQELVPIDSWKYVPTQSNPADVASRGIYPSQLANFTMWWSGPDWLHQTEDKWPQQNVITASSNLEINISLATAAPQPKFSLATHLLEKYSNINMLLAVTSWCNRFIAARLNQPHERTSWCTATERGTALQFWIRYVQNSHFTNEVACLRCSKPISRKSKLLKLNPMLDDDGLVKLNGRLKNATIPIYERFPIILPKDSPLCTMLIAQAHECTLHGGVQSTLNFLRRRYWVIDSRSSVKRYIHRCIRCIRYRSNAATQLMGSLPAHRCNISRPFSHCGLDYGGPYSIRTTKGRGHHSYKGYLALFVCFSTRAVHLELVSDMSTETFLAALRRFFSVRGYSSDIYSDCATTFIGANAELRENRAAIRKQFETAASVMSTRGVSWHFIPPGSPNFGGIWEAGIKSTKHHLKRTIGSATLTFEEFYTVLKQIEAVLNSRPICALNDDPNDLSVLTPGHFLVGGPILVTTDLNQLEVDTSRLKRWKQVQQMQQDFWKRWSYEYLRELQVRHKWFQQKENLRVGNLVLLRDERAPPTHWPLGRVIEVHPGDDGIVATIRTASSILKRAISKLVALPMEDEGPPMVGGKSSNISSQQVDEVGGMLQSNANLG